MHKGLRYNAGKQRYDLLPQHAISGMVDVLTYGAQKYEPRNWEKGMAWSNVTASLKRHLAAFEMGEDYDQETGLLHTSHIMCNAAFLSEYYSIYPQGDDRSVFTVNSRNIGLDIDDVLSDFLEFYCDKFNLHIPEFWYFDHLMGERLNSLGEDFWLNIPVKNEPESLSFEPFCYVTSRRKSLYDVTRKWLDLNGYSNAPLFMAESPENKAEICKSIGVDIFIDDSYANYLAMHKAGVFCYLYTAEHNKRYNVGHRRLNKLNF